MAERQSNPLWQHCWPAARVVHSNTVYSPQEVVLVSTSLAARRISAIRQAAQTRGHSVLPFFRRATYHSDTVKETKMAKFLVHVTCSPTDTAKAALSFLVAKSAIEEGHTVTIFLAGDAVTLLKDDTLDTLVGLGTGKLKDHYSFLSQNGARFFLSGMSSKARGMSEADLVGKPAEFAMPTVLVRLAAEADKVFTY